MTRFQPLLRAPGQYLIEITLFVALLTVLLPFSIEKLVWIPDLLCMVLLYWAINLPNKVNMGSAFFWGLLADLMTGVPLGQHAIVYIISTAIVLMRQSQIVAMNLGLQAIVVAVLLCLNLLLTSLIRAVYGETVLYWTIYFSPVFSILLWPMIDKIMVWLSYRKVR